MSLRNFIRLVDKAVEEYQIARNAIMADIDEEIRPIEEMMEQGRIIYKYGFTDHFENCINAVNRLLKQLEGIKSQGKENWNLSRISRKLIDTHSKSIPDIRDAAEHMEEKIQTGELKEGEAVMVMIGTTGDRAVLAKLEVKFYDLFITIRSLHRIAIHLLDSLPKEIHPEIQSEDD